MTISIIRWVLFFIWRGFEERDRSFSDNAKYRTIGNSECVPFIITGDVMIYNQGVSHVLSLDTYYLILLSSLSLKEAK